MIEKIEEIDRNLFLALNFEGGPLADIFFWIVTSKTVWIPLYLWMMWMIYRRKGLKMAILAAVMMGIMVGLIDQTCNFFKSYIPSPRPSHTPELQGMVHTIYDYWGGFSGTASAHAGISFGLAVNSSLIIRKRIYTVLIILWAALVAYSRIYAGVHYPIDLLLGMVIGTFYAVVTYWGYQLLSAWFEKRTRIKRTVAENPETAE